MTPKIIDSLKCEINDEQNVDGCFIRVKTFLEENKIQKANCYCILSDEDYQLLLLDPPEVPENEMVDAIRWRVKDLIETSLDDIVIDIFQQPGKKMMYTVVAEKNKVINIVERVKELGLRLIAIDIEELAYRNFFENYALMISDKNEIENIKLKEESSHVVQERALAIVNLYKGEGRVLILKQGQLYLTRRFSFNQGDGVFDELPEDEMILEVQRSLDYFERQMNQPPPSEIIFLGESLDESIPAAIQSGFQQKIHCLNLDSVFPNYDKTLTTTEIVKLYGGSMWRETA